MKRILITGATGLVGQEIVKQCLAKNIHVNYLSTSKSKLENKPNYKGFYWNPSLGEIDVNCFHKVDTIINLAGATIAKRWTQVYKEEIKNSRVNSLKLLYKTIESKNISLKHIISASAVGIYPDSLTHYYEEDFKDFDDRFLAKVVTSWENEADQFKSLNIKVSKIRIGIVLSEKGGALPQLVKPIRWFVGSALGSGNQWQSWIHIDDLIQMIDYCLINKLEGCFNATAPNPVQQRTLIKTIAKRLRVPQFLPGIPKFVMAFALGEMHQVLYESVWATPKNVLDQRFSFQFPDISSCVYDLMKPK